MEQWKVIEGYENYSISSFARIKNNRTGNVLKTVRHKSGYEVINIKPNGRGKGKTLKIHREVAKAFIENPEGKIQVNHINAIRWDNRLENLEWVTPQENSLHRHETGTMHIFNLKAQKLNADQVSYIKENFVSGCKINGTMALARKFNVTHNLIYRILKKTHYKNYNEN